MKKKYIFISVIIFMLAFTCSVFASGNTEEYDDTNESLGFFQKLVGIIHSFDFNPEKITVDTYQTYIGISKNDIIEDSYLPFEFSFKRTFGVVTNQYTNYMDNYISERISYVEIYDMDNRLIYAGDVDDVDVFKTGINTMKIRLEIAANYENFSFNNTKRLNEIVVTYDNQRLSSILPLYLVEMQSTLTEDNTEIIVHSVSSDVPYTDNNTANIIYRLEKFFDTINDFDIYYAWEFDEVLTHSYKGEYESAYDITENLEKVENRFDYYVEANISKDSNRILFKPFIKVTYEGTQTGYLLSSDYTTLYRK
ncbi:MAG: hypothetical protein ACK5LV_07060 [Lachnospirales bacterium]